MEAITITYPQIWLGLWVIFALYLLLKNSFKIWDDLGGFPLHELTVLIPFRNEAENLEALLKSILEQNKQPAKYIFINDHSTDNGLEIIDLKLKSSGINYEILNLPEELIGKKHALMAAAKMVQTEYLHTLDADVRFKPNFFANLPKPNDAQMMILPVRMLGNNVLTKLMELEYGSFQILQAAVPRNKPLMASGANLIVHHHTYLSTNNLSKHAHRSSGDDQYALAQFIAADKKINTYFDSDLAVFTKTPENVKKLLTQRTRWMGNNTQGNDYRALLVSVFIFIVNMSFFWILIHGLLFGFSGMALQITLSKILADFLMYFAWFKRNSTWHLTFYLPILSMVYPLYLIALLSRYLSSGKQFWKMREV